MAGIPPNRRVNVEPATSLEYKATIRFPPLPAKTDAQSFPAFSPATFETTACAPPAGSMPFCVELDNLKDTDAPIHQPAAMLVAAD